MGPLALLQHGFDPGVFLVLLLLFFVGIVIVFVLLLLCGGGTPCCSTHSILVNPCNGSDADADNERNNGGVTSLKVAKSY